MIWQRVGVSKTVGGLTAPRNSNTGAKQTAPIHGVIGSAPEYSELTHAGRSVHEALRLLPYIQHTSLFRHKIAVRTLK